MIHFEDLWDKCEKLHQEMGNDPNEFNSSHILDELLMKINLYKVIDAKTEIPEEDRKKIKSRTLGEILLTLTHVSYQDNIDVFEALNSALQYRQIGFFNKKY